MCQIVALDYNKYNFGDLYETYTKETYFKLAVDKYIEGVIKRGYHIASKTQVIVDYLRKRIKEIGSKHSMSFFRQYYSLTHKYLHACSNTDLRTH